MNVVVPMVLAALSGALVAAVLMGVLWWLL